MEKNSAQIRYFSTVTCRNVDWLWYPYIPFGKVTIIQGDPGDGKTTLVLNIAALLSNGMPMPESNTKISAAKVIYQSAEDGAEDTLKPRLISAGADCSQIAFIDESDSVLTFSDRRIEWAIRETEARLIVLDPLQAYLGESNEMSRADGIRPSRHNEKKRMHQMFLSAKQALVDVAMDRIRERTISKSQEEWVELLIARIAYIDGAMDWLH